MSWPDSSFVDFTVRSTIGDGEHGRRGGNGYWWYTGEDEHDQRGTMLYASAAIINVSELTNN